MTLSDDDWKVVIVPNDTNTILKNKVLKVIVSGALLPTVNGIYTSQDPESIPKGFAFVCEQQNWDIQTTWDNLASKELFWFLKSDGSYIYYNRCDNNWWIDCPNGCGLYINNNSNKCVDVVVSNRNCPISVITDKGIICSEKDRHSLSHRQAISHELYQNFLPPKTGWTSLNKARSIADITVMEYHE